MKVKIADRWLGFVLCFAFLGAAAYGVMWGFILGGWLWAWMLR